MRGLACANAAAAGTSSDISAQEDMIGLEIRYFVYPPPVKIRLQAKFLPTTCREYQDERPRPSPRLRPGDTGHPTQRLAPGWAPRPAAGHLPGAPAVCGAAPCPPALPTRSMSSAITSLRTNTTGHRQALIRTWTGCQINADAVRDDLRAFVAGQLGRPAGVLIPDETGSNRRPSAFQD
jgi:hypothetical protein